MTRKSCPQFSSEALEMLWLPEKLVFFRVCFLQLPLFRYIKVRPLVSKDRQKGKQNDFKLYLHSSSYQVLETSVKHNVYLNSKLEF